MPKQTEKPLTDKQKIRMLERDIKDMQRDFRETFSVFEDEKPKRKLSPLWIVLAVIITAVLAYFVITLI